MKAPNHIRSPQEDGEMRDGRGRILYGGPNPPTDRHPLNEEWFDQDIIEQFPKE